MSRFSRSVRGFSLLTACLIGSSFPALSAGFYIQEQSVTGLGRAFAGQAADPIDASTIFSNPAGMVELDGAQMTVGAHLLVPTIDVKDKGSTRTVGGVTTSTAAPGTDRFTSAMVPNFYVAMPLTEDNRLWAGLGVSAPFGTVTEYDTGWFGRYDSLRSDLLTINITPSVAYKVSDWLSIGGGVDIQYADVELISAQFTGGPDGRSRVYGNDLSFGINAGFIAHPWEGGSLGVHYRSQITHDISGRAQVNVGPVTLVDTKAKAKLNLPDIVGVGFAQNVTPDLKLLAQVNWFNWSRFEEIRIKTATSENLREQDYDDTFSVALGGEYKLSDSWTLRGGMQWDETPTTDARRSTRIPDEDRLWLALGASYNLNANVSFDLGYAHIFYKSIDVDVTDSLAAGVTARTRAEYDNDPNIFSAALRYRF